jgi:hypothetical protein
MGFGFLASIQVPASQRCSATSAMGRWLLAPAGGVRRLSRRYRPETLVLETAD